MYHTRNLAATTHQYLLSVPVNVAIVLIVGNGIPAHQLDIVVKLLLADVIPGHHAFLPSSNISCLPREALRTIILGPTSISRSDIGLSMAL